MESQIKSDFSIKHIQFEKFDERDFAELVASHEKTHCAIKVCTIFANFCLFDT